MTKAVSEMNGPELVAEFNRLASTNGQKPVKRFATRKAALKRIVALKKEPTVKGKAPKAKKAPKEDKRSKIGVEFNVRAGTNREKLLDALYDSYKKPITKRDLMKAVYGNVADENKAAVQMVMNGLYYMIDKGKLPYKIMKQKNEQKEITFGLYPK